MESLTYTKIPKWKVLIVFFNLPRLLLHLLFFGFYYNKCKMDVSANIAQRKFKCNNVMGFLYLLVFDRTFRNLFYWRVGKFKYLIWYFLWPHPCFTIATDSEIGHSFTCVHPFSTIVNAERIGHNFLIRNNVTIGNNKSGERPSIGDNVCINANSVVIGRIKIGDNVVIGAGAVVTKDVPSDCVVVGNPAYILKEKGITVKRPL